jgi:hypothetical protein
MKWIQDIFRAGAVNKGGIVRRSRSDVIANGGYLTLKQEVKRRGFHMLRTGGQYVIVCNKGDFKILC